MPRQREASVGVGAVGTRRPPAPLRLLRHLVGPEAGANRMITEALEISKGLRVPVFEHGVMPRTKIEQLESYLLLSAFQQGQLAEERLDALVALREVGREWDHLNGWEHLKRTRTEAAVEDAKRQVRPDLYDQKRDLEWTIKRLSEEIERLERDATKVSRAYSMMTGT